MEVFTGSKKRTPVRRSDGQEFDSMFEVHRTHPDKYSVNDIVAIRRKLKSGKIDVVDKHGYRWNRTDVDARDAVADFETRVLAGTFQHNEKDDCTVKAVCLVSGRTYAEVHKLFALHGRRRRKATSRYITEKVITELGLSWEETRRPRSKSGKAFTFQSICRVLDPKSKYLIFMRGHVEAMVNGTVPGWAGKSRCIVREVYRIK